MMKKTNDEIKNGNKIYSKLIDIIFIILGAYLVSLGINMFLLPHKMTTGGASRCCNNIILFI